MDYLIERIIEYFHRWLNDLLPISAPTTNPSIMTFEDIPNIIAFGNVLLDCSVEIPNTDILDKYSLLEGSQSEMNIEKLTKILLEIEQNTQLQINYHPGGSSLNTVRILYKLNYKKVKFFGAIGNDENGSKIKNILIENDVNFTLQNITSVPTGQCLCFILRDQSTLYANIGASKYFTKDFLKKSESNFFYNSTNALQIYYIEGYFIPNRYDVCNFIINNYINKNKLLAINLNSSYIIRENLDMIRSLILHSTLVFGNREQYETLIDKFGYKNLTSLAENLCKNERKIFVCTDGEKQVECYSNFENDKFDILKVPVPKVKTENICDTTGAGDSFVAGFLQLFVKKLPLKECILNGCQIAEKVINQMGCNLPDCI